MSLRTERLLLRPWRDADREPFAAMNADPRTAPFIGFIGLAVPSFDAPFMPCVEIGWRLAYAHWNRGYATEGARAALEYGFDRLSLPQIVAFTVAANVRSRSVIEKLGMTCNAADDFDHPRIAEGHPLRRHVLYRIGRTNEPTNTRTDEPTN